MTETMPSEWTDPAVLPAAEAAALLADAPWKRMVTIGDSVAAQVAAEQLAPALTFGPDLAFVVAGGNDMLRPHFDADEVRRELAAMVSALRSAGADVVTIGLLDITVAGLGPPRYREVMSSRTRRLNALAADVAAEHGACHAVNPHDHPVAADPGIYSGDQLHLNARGHAFAAANTVRALADYLASA